MLHALSFQGNAPTEPFTATFLRAKETCPRLLRPTGAGRCHAIKVSRPPKQGDSFQTAYWEKPQNNFQTLPANSSGESLQRKTKQGQGQATVATSYFQGLGMLPSPPEFTSTDTTTAWRPLMPAWSRILHNYL